MLARLVTRAACASLALGVVVTSCAVVGNYDFDGYRSTLSGAGGSGGSVASGTGTSGTGTGTGGSIDQPDASSDGPPTCISLTCADLHADCGKVPDGCGGVLDCGGCEVGVCGGAGRNKCGLDPCTA